MLKIISKLLLLKLLGLSLAFGQETQAPNLALLKSDAMRSYTEARVEDTITAYLALSEIIPADPEIWFRLSEAYEWNGELENAIAAAENSLNLGYLSPANKAYRLARLNAVLSRDEQALDWLNESLKLRFDDRPGIADDPAFQNLKNQERFIRLAGILANRTDLSREQGLEFDLAYLIEEAQRMHASPDRPAYSDAFLTDAENIRTSIASSTDLEFYVNLMRLVAKLNDGHSAIYGPDQDSPLAIESAILPLKFYLFDEGLFIVDGIAAADVYAGYQVLSFGALAAADLMDQLSQLRGVDNAMTWQWMGPQFYLNRMELLNYLGASSSMETMRLTLKSPAGDIAEVEITAGEYQIQRKLGPSPAATGEIPLYLQQVNRNFWLQDIPENDALYFQFNQVRDDGNEFITEFSTRLIDRLNSGSVHNLIIDVRHNNGGNNSLLVPLVQALISFEQQSDENRLYVITGRNTFSAAQNFINHLDKWTDAIFVGEPSSSSPNFVGEETNVFLPYSRIRGSISTQYWQDSVPGDDREWIAVDIPVPVKATDYFLNHDAALAEIYRLIRVNR